MTAKYDVSRLIDALEYAKDRLEALEDAGEATAKDKAALNKIYEALRPR